ncbi:PREDICTED: ABC transporter C family member 4-like [Camelina sativa]|uniref:ABC transporter C family member 4-like n=1 Tax=Camelina sativa TaxID=90675 RepID=A0ABM1R9Q5_CAMSA|nr:PREDICTED: ABC transporter C family member 4-like [Camelina sativa]
MSVCQIGFDTFPVCLNCMHSLYAESLNSVLLWAIYMNCFVENKMVSVERIKQFTDIPSESEWERKENLPHLNWPFHGSVHLEDLKVRYRPNTPLMLKGISTRLVVDLKLQLTKERILEDKWLLVLYVYEFFFPNVLD